MGQDQQLLFCGCSSGSNQASHSSAVGKTGTIYWVSAGNCPVHLPGINFAEKYSRAVIKRGQTWRHRVGFVFKGEDFAAPKQGGDGGCRSQFWVRAELAAGVGGTSPTTSARLLGNAC